MRGAILVLGLLVMTMACGDDGGPDPTDAAGAIDADDAPDASQPDAMIGSAPSINTVAWVPVGSCTNNVASDMRITVTANDIETPVANLVYSGSVGGCSGSIDAAVSTIGCPQAAPYSGSVTVTDGDGNPAVANFSFAPCETGSVTP